MGASALDAPGVVAALAATAPHNAGSMSSLRPSAAGSGGGSTLGAESAHGGAAGVGAADADDDEVGPEGVDLEGVDVVVDSVANAAGGGGECAPARGGGIGGRKGGGTLGVGGVGGGKSAGSDVGDDDVGSEPWSEADDGVCSICMDSPVAVQVTGCQHGLCVQCAFQLTIKGRELPICPFCRKKIPAFEATTRTPSAGVFAAAAAAVAAPTVAASSRTVTVPQV
eukprot:361238-Chlamydomonas_euryale.AAC.1